MSKSTAAHRESIRSYITASRKQGRDATKSNEYHTLLTSMVERTIGFAAYSPFALDRSEVVNYTKVFLHGVAKRRAKGIPVENFLAFSHALVGELTDPRQEAHQMADCPVRKSAGEDDDGTLPEPVFSDDNPALVEPGLHVEELDRVMRWLVKWGRVEDSLLGYMAEAARHSIAGMLTYIDDLVDEQPIA
jgi:hypothetical protein